MSGEITSADMRAYMAEEKARRNYSKWMARVSKKLPALSARVFALRDTGYHGCGFHWSLESRLGRVIMIATNAEEDVWHGKEAYANRLINEILVESLHKDVACIEASLSPTPTLKMGCLVPPATATSMNGVDER